MLHDVVDERAKLDADGTTTSDLVAFFEYLVSNGWHALTLDEIDRAGRGETTLPEKSILITIDDAYASDYTRVFPLLLATRMHAIVAIAGRVDGSRPGPGGPGGAHVGAGARDAAERPRRVRVARLRFAQRDSRQSAGEPGSGVLVPDLRPRTRLRGRRRVPPSREADLQQSIDVMTRELGRAPRAIAWPYGRYTQAAVEVAKELGFRFALTFDPEPAVGEPPVRDRAGSRSPPGRRCPPLVERLRVGDTLPRVQRFVRLRPSSLWRPDPAETERLLGAAIERVRILGATTIVIDAVEPGPDGRPAAWFPTTTRYPSAPTSTCGSRGSFRRERVCACTRGCPRRRSSIDDAELEGLCRDFGIFTSVDGLLVEEVGALVGPGDVGSGARWEVARARRAIDAAQLPPAGATSPDLLQGRGTRAAGSSARVDHG